MRYAIFLRGVNVGGHGKLPMKPFCASLTEAGLENVSSYIQSGNIVCNSDLPASEIAATVARVMQTAFGLTRPVLVRTAAELSQIIDTSPVEAELTPKSLMIYLHPGCADIAPVSEVLSNSERVTAHDGYTLLWAPDGVGRSKAAAKMDAHLPSPATARNLNTLLAMAARL